MDKKILFSLEECMKCVQTKNLINEKMGISIVTFPHDMSNWTDVQKNQAVEYDVIDDLQKTAPILWVEGEKFVGYLRIRKWLQDHY